MTHAPAPPPEVIDLTAVLLHLKQHNPVRAAPVYRAARQVDYVPMTEAECIEGDLINNTDKAEKAHRAHDRLGQRHENWRY